MLFACNKFRKISSEFVKCLIAKNDLFSHRVFGILVKQERCKDFLAQFIEIMRQIAAIKSYISTPCLHERAFRGLKSMVSIAQDDKSQDREACMGAVSLLLALADRRPSRVGFRVG
jgi:hypothetical protein